MNAAPMLEAAMLACFGVSWPLAAWRMLRLRRAEGRGFVPTTLVLAGYVAGITAKLCVACGGGPLAPVFWLYLLNACSVSVNLALQWHFGRVSGQRPPIRTSR